MYIDGYPFALLYGQSCRTLFWTESKSSLQTHACIMVVTVAPLGAVRDFLTLKLDLTLTLVHADSGSEKYLLHRCTLVKTSCFIALCISFTSPFGTAFCKEEVLQQSPGVLFPTSLLRLSWHKRSWSNVGFGPVTRGRENVWMWNSYRENMSGSFSNTPTKIIRSVTGDGRDSWLILLIWLISLIILWASDKTKDTFVTKKISSNRLASWRGLHMPCCKRRKSVPWPYPRISLLKLSKTSESLQMFPLPNCSKTIPHLIQMQHPKLVGVRTEAWLE